jgi:anti-sigma regulatory factor (Ser/Thr protein kinase)
MEEPLSAGVIAPCDHVVQFYAHDQELVESVGGYLIDALQAGGVALIVATAPHRAEFESQIAAAGVELSSARAAGALVSLDARDTMERFLAAGRPDPGRFHAVVGDLVRRATETGRPVHVYGEMVDLLWHAGHVNAAIELERLWNDLGRELPFSLFCAYRTESGCADDSFGEVCRLHSAVVSPPSAAGTAVEASRSFGLDLSGARQARHFVRTTLQGWADHELMDDAVLVVSELASNAIIHARSAFTVTVRAGEELARIAVREDGSARPSDPMPTLVAATGRGLGLVAALSARWGAEAAGDGRRLVWAELARAAVPAR